MRMSEKPIKVELSDKDRRLIRELINAIKVTTKDEDDAADSVVQLVESPPPEDLWGSGYRPYWGDEPRWRPNQG